VATASSDQAARVWEASSGREIARMEHESYVLNVVFGAKGHLASLSAEGVIKVWYWQPEDLIEQACSRLQRNLTQDEWQYNLGDVPYRKSCLKLPEPAQ
jgi:WD40 repeat protein